MFNQGTYTSELTTRFRDGTSTHFLYSPVYKLSSSPSSLRNGRPRRGGVCPYQAPLHTLPPLSQHQTLLTPLLLTRLSLTLLQADKLRAQQQLEQLQARYVGTGHADTTKFEWTSNIQRDSYASYVGHPPLLSYMAIGMGECREKIRAQMVEVSALVLGSIFYGIEANEWCCRK
jgi:splicing factor 3B subunit 5